MTSNTPSDPHIGVVRPRPECGPWSDAIVPVVRVSRPVTRFGARFAAPVDRVAMASKAFPCGAELDLSFDEVERFDPDLQAKAAMEGVIA